jgi:predicted Rossmann fold nucleotide-binding protein DprA/Smf involved in DNA uptake
LDNLPVLLLNEAGKEPGSPSRPGVSGLPLSAGVGQLTPADNPGKDQNKGDTAIWDERPVAPETFRRVLALLSPEPTSVDDIVRRCQLSPPATVAVLLELELTGRVETLPGNRVALLPGGID